MPGWCAWQTACRRQWRAGGGKQVEWLVGAAARTWSSLPIISESTIGVQAPAKSPDSLETCGFKAWGPGASPVPAHCLS